MFAKLLRRSRLAAFQPAVDSSSSAEAVYVAGTSGGDYGLKRAVPKHLQTEAIHVQDLDKAGLVRVKDASWSAFRYSMLSQLALQLNKTGIIDSSSSSATVKQESGASQKDISRLTQQEFDNLLVQARQRRQQFLDETSDAPIQRKSASTVSQFMGLSRRHGNQLNNSDSAASERPLLDYLKSTADKKNSDGDKAQTLPRVKGRILERTSGGYLVGVGGIVAFLPQKATTMSTIPGWNPEDRRKLYDFHVRELKVVADAVDGQQRVLVKLTTDPNPPQNTNNSSSSKSSSKEPGQQQRQQRQYQNDTENQLQSLLNDLLDMESSTSPKKKQ